MDVYINYVNVKLQISIK